MEANRGKIEKVKELAKTDEIPYITGKSETACDYTYDNRSALSTDFIFVGDSVNAVSLIIKIKPSPKFLAPPSSQFLITNHSKADKEELQWVEHLWNHEIIFETGAVRANEY